MTSGFSDFAWVSSAVKSCCSAVTPKVPRISPPFSVTYSAEVLVVAFAVVGGVVDDHPGLVAEPGHEIGGRVVLVDHGAVDAVDLRVVVAVGDVGQDRAPDDHRQAELVIGVDRADRDRRAVVGDPGHDVVVGGGLGRHLDADVRFALVVEHDHLVLVLGVRVGIAQPDRQIGGIAPAQAIRRDAAGERPDERHLDQVLGERRRPERRCGGCGERECGDAACGAMHDPILPDLDQLSPSLPLLPGVGQHRRVQDRPGQALERQHVTPRRSGLVITRAACSFESHGGKRMQSGLAALRSSPVVLPGLGLTTLTCARVWPLIAAAARRGG